MTHRSKSTCWPTTGACNFTRPMPSRPKWIRNNKCIDPTFDRRQPNVWSDYDSVPQDDVWFSFFKEHLPAEGWTEAADYMTGGGTMRVLNYTKHFPPFDGRLIVTRGEVIAEVAAPDFCPSG